MNRTKRAILLCLAVAAATAASSVPNDIFRTGFLPKARIAPHAQQTPRRLAKTATLVWRQVGSTHFVNAASSGSFAEWTLGSRDTMVYNVAGNMVLEKISRAQSGWKADSLESLDSSVYVGGKLSERVFLYFDRYEGSSQWGYRYTYAYLDGGKTLVSIGYEWNSPTNAWSAIWKDSTIFLAPIGNGDEWYMNLTNFAGEYMYRFDTLSSSWKRSGYVTKVAAECNATTLVVGGRGLFGSDIDSAVDEKESITFATSNWSNSNITEEKMQRKNPSTGIYYDVEKMVTTSTEEDQYSWDTTAKSWNCTYKLFYDSHGNDTLDFNYYYDSSASAWDTSAYRHARTYDADGNNIVTVESYFDSYDKSWRIESKDVNAFARINAPVIRSIQSSSAQKICLQTTPAFVRFSAPDITALNLYAASGRLVVSIKQPASPAISLNLANSHAPVPAGMYIAELVCKSGRKSFAVPIQR